MQQVQPREWHRFGFGGPPEPWERGAQRDLDRLATSYYLDILQSRQVMRKLAGAKGDAHRLEELFTAATRHKHQIDYTLRHPATPAERAQVENWVGSLMRIGLLMRSLLDGNSADPATEPMPAA
jgi:hypothetical protein